MSEELLNIAKELSEKPTTELALQFMELTADNIIKDKEIERLKEELEKEKYLVDKYTRQLTDEYKNTEYQCKEKERLNNIINKLETELIGIYEGEYALNEEEIKDKLKALKENK